MEISLLLLCCGNSWLLLLGNAELLQVDSPFSAATAVPVQLRQLRAGALPFFHFDTTLIRKSLWLFHYTSQARERRCEGSDGFVAKQVMSNSRGREREANILVDE